MGVGSGFVICCQRFFLVACFLFFSLVLYLSLYLNLKTLSLLPDIFIQLYRQRYNNGVTFFFLIFASLFRMEGGRFLQKEPVFYN